MTWTSDDGCKVWHPRLGWLPVRMMDGCPELDRGLGLELIKEAEGVKRSRAEAEIYVRELRAHVGDMDFWEQGKKVVDSLPNGTDEAYKWLARMFPQAPSWLLAAIPVKSGMDGPRVPWNRRERKKWKRVSSLVIHLFCGKDRRFWKAEDDQSHVINVDQAENPMSNLYSSQTLHAGCTWRWTPPFACSVWAREIRVGRVDRLGVEEGQGRLHPYLSDDLPTAAG